MCAKPDSGGRIYFGNMKRLIAALSDREMIYKQCTLGHFIGKVGEGNNL